VRSDLGLATNAQLLGYTGALRALGTTLGPSTDEATLRFDLVGERYFIILKAYSLRQKIAAGQPRRAVWTLHLNMRSPGTNFREARDRMSVTAADFFGRLTDAIQTVHSRPRDGRVEVGTPVVVGEKKN